ncbi:hypothetical protein AAC387_Pa03g2807 [Persea americana]
MTTHFRSLATLTAVILILHFHLSLSICHESSTPTPRGGQVRRLLLHEQTLKNLQGDEKMHDKQTMASFRRIPPSMPNPTQNKSKPRNLGSMA